MTSLVFLIPVLVLGLLTLFALSASVLWWAWCAVVRREKRRARDQIARHELKMRVFRR